MPTTPLEARLEFPTSKLSRLRVNALDVLHRFDSLHGDREVVDPHDRLDEQIQHAVDVHDLRGGQGRALDCIRELPFVARDFRENPNERALDGRSEVHGLNLRRVTLHRKTTIGQLKRDEFDIQLFEHLLDDMSGSLRGDEIELARHNFPTYELRELTLHMHSFFGGIIRPHLEILNHSQ